VTFESSSLYIDIMVGLPLISAFSYSWGFSILLIVNLHLTAFLDYTGSARAAGFRYTARFTDFLRPIHGRFLAGCVHHEIALHGWRTHRRRILLCAAGRLCMCAYIMQAFLYRARLDSIQVREHNRD
jgi:hypothetical protein